MIDTDPGTALTRLQRRLDEIDALADTKNPDDPRFAIAERNITSDVLDVFGEGSPEFHVYEHYNIWDGEFSLAPLPENEMLRRRVAGVAKARLEVQSLASRVQERLSITSAPAIGTTTSRAEMIGEWRVIKALRRDGQGEVFLVERQGSAGHALGVLKRVPRDVAAEANVSRSAIFEGKHAWGEHAR